MALRADEPVMARWDNRLADTMSERRVVVHEEGAVEILLTDIAANRPDYGCSHCLIRNVTAADWLPHLNCYQQVMRP
jgi:hypothetical protein